MRARRVVVWVKGVLFRPRRPVPDRRHARKSRAAPLDHDADAAPVADARVRAVAQQREELFSRLVVHDPTTQFVHHLFIVHTELRRGGWEAVEGLHPKVLDRALFEAEIMARDEPTATFAIVVDTLRRLQLAAAARAEREAVEQAHDWKRPPVAEVADSDFAEFELMERSWAGTVPGGL